MKENWNKVFTCQDVCTKEMIFTKICSQIYALKLSLFKAKLDRYWDKSDEKKTSAAYRHEGELPLEWAEQVRGGLHQSIQLVFARH